MGRGATGSKGSSDPPPTFSAAVHIMALDPSLFVKNVTYVCKTSAKAIILHCLDAIFKSHALFPGLCPGPRWGSLQRSPKPLSWWGGGSVPLPKNTSPALGPSGLERRPHSADPLIEIWQIQPCMYACWFASCSNYQINIVPNNLKLKSNNSMHTIQYNTIQYNTMRVFSAPYTRNRTGRHYNSHRMCVE